MKRIAVSNIAWAPQDDDAVAAALRARGVELVEVAPTKRWPDPAAATAPEAAAWRAEWRARGFTIPSMQSLLFGRPDLVLFGGPESRERTLAYLDALFGVAAALGAGPLVFGSPANRRVGAMPKDEARAIALEWFRRAGARADARGVTLCIEPNPPQYGCDFLTNTADCVAFLEEAAQPGLALHLDAAAMALNAEDPDDAIDRAAPWILHYHASEPYLAPLSRPIVDHAAHARALRRVGYEGLVSIEMKADPDAPAVDHVLGALDTVERSYATLLG